LRVSPQEPTVFRLGMFRNHLVVEALERGESPPSISLISLACLSAQRARLFERFLWELYASPLENFTHDVLELRERAVFRYVLGTDVLSKLLSLRG